MPVVCLLYSRGPLWLRRRTRLASRLWHVCLLVVKTTLIHIPCRVTSPGLEGAGLNRGRPGTVSCLPRDHHAAAQCQQAVTAHFSSRQLPVLPGLLFLALPSIICGCLGRYRDQAPTRIYNSPANIRPWSNIGLLLGQRRSWWANNKPALGQRLTFSGRLWLIKGFGLSL